MGRPIPMFDLYPASVVLLLALSFCFLAGTFGSCSKHKKTKLPENPSSDKV